MHTGPSIQSNVTHVEGVKMHTGPLNTKQYRAMLLMLEVSKVHTGPLNTE